MEHNPKRIQKKYTIVLICSRICLADTDVWRSENNKDAATRSFTSRLNGTAQSENKPSVLFLPGRVPQNQPTLRCILYKIIQN